MKANIVLGGLLGLALGAGAVFAVSHGAFASVHADDSPMVETAGDDAQASTESDGPSLHEGTAPIRQRPLRPGSERIGHTLLAPAQS